MKTIITIEGSDFTVTTTEIESVISPDDELWFPDGVSRTIYSMDGVACHQIKHVNDFLEEMSTSSDKFQRDLAFRHPNHFLMFHDHIEYPATTAYQVFRNQQHYFPVGSGAYSGHEFGPYFINTKTKETSYEPKGFSPFDDWEKIREPDMRRLPNVLVACGGNFSAVKVLPWYTIAAPDDKYQEFLDLMFISLKKNFHDEVSRLRLAAGNK